MTRIDGNPIRLTFVRHGEALYNTLNRVNANPEVVNDLTERGRQQAAQCATALAEEKFDAAYCSEFPRARQTAEAIVAPHRLPLHIDRRINETGAFAFDGRPCPEWHAAQVPDRFTAEISGCEAFPPFKARLASFLDDLIARPERNVLVVSHEEPIQIMLGILESRTDREARARPINHCMPYRWQGRGIEREN